MSDLAAYRCEYEKTAERVWTCASCGDHWIDASPPQISDLCLTKVAALEAERDALAIAADLSRCDVCGEGATELGFETGQARCAAHPLGPADATITALRAELAAAKAGLEFYRDVDADTFDGDAMAWEAYCHHDMSRRARADLARLCAWRDVEASE